MKVVILAGGMGTRLGEETVSKPKPMVEIGGKPILWHIMKIYSVYGFTEFVICCGYKGPMIKDYFINYYQHQSDCTYDLQSGAVRLARSEVEPWKVTLVNTGFQTLTAGRIMRVRKYLNDEPFMLTYGDGVSDINVKELLSFHESKRKLITISTTQPEGRFGAVKMHEGIVDGFKEKARSDQSWVNMGFMVCEPGVFDYLQREDVMLESEPFEKLAADRQMAAYQHKGFWSPMDNVHDRDYLESLWQRGNAPWKGWK